VDQGKWRPDNPNDIHYHHIIPNHQITQLISRTEKAENKINQFDDYVNQPHIKKTIIDKDLTNPNLDHGVVIHAAIANNPHNLVAGPKRDDRCDDQGGKKDTSIFNAQSKDYQTAVKNYENEPTLENFGNIPAPTPINWKRNQNQGNRYCVPKDDKKKK
jgi:hypothetical protein